MSDLCGNGLRRIRRYQSVLASFVLSITLLPVITVTAKPVTYDFTVNVVQGKLKDKSFNGFFTYDDEQLEGSETEVLGVSEGLRVCLNFFEKIHSEQDDVDYPQYPQLIFKEGKPETLDFWGESAKRRVWWNVNGWEVEVSPRPGEEVISDCQL